MVESEGALWGDTNWEWERQCSGFNQIDKRRPVVSGMCVCSCTQ